jgi:hypothetical protein
MSTATILAAAAIEAIKPDSANVYRTELKKKGPLVETEDDFENLIEIGESTLEAHLCRVIMRALPIGLAKTSTIDVRIIIDSLKRCLTNFKVCD